MHIVIMGCGRTGAALAADLERRGHTVAVIDRQAEAFTRLPTDFQGTTVTGMGFDRETLVAAGVHDAYGFAAVSSGDNSNIVAARVVRETYSVANVVARISDPGRAEVVARLGIATVAPVPWTTTQIVTRLLPGGAEELVVDAASGASIERLAVPKTWVGVPYRTMQESVGARVAYVVRFGSALLPKDDAVVQAADDVVFVLLAASAAATRRALAAGPRREAGA